MNFVVNELYYVSSRYIAKEVQDEHYKNYTNLFKDAFPEWSGVPLTPEQSVTAMMTTVSKLTSADSGKFITHVGDTKTWL